MALSTGRRFGARPTREQPQQTFVSRWLPRGVYVMQMRLAKRTSSQYPEYWVCRCVCTSILLSATHSKIHDELLIIALYSNFSTSSKVFYFPPLLLVLYCFKPKGGGSNWLGFLLLFPFFVPPLAGPEKKFPECNRSELSRELCWVKKGYNQAGERNKRSLPILVKYFYSKLCLLNRFNKDHLQLELKNNRVVFFNLPTHRIFNYPWKKGCIALAKLQDSIQVR